MAKKEIYAIYDLVKEECGQLNLYKNRQEALRAYDSAMTNLDNDINSPAVSSDYNLIFIGIIDDETMKSTIGDPETVIRSVGVSDE